MYIRLSILPRDETRDQSASCREIGATKRKRERENIEIKEGGGRGIAKRNNPIRREVVALALEGSKKVPD